MSLSLGLWWFGTSSSCNIDCEGRFCATQALHLLTLRLPMTTNLFHPLSAQHHLTMPCCQTLPSSGIEATENSACHPPSPQQGLSCPSPNLSAAQTKRSFCRCHARGLYLLSEVSVRSNALVDTNRILSNYYHPIIIIHLLKITCEMKSILFLKTTINFLLSILWIE